MSVLTCKRSINFIINIQVYTCIHMTIIYTTHSLQVIPKKKGLTAKQSIAGSFADPVQAYKCACELIRDIIAREKYFTDEIELCKAREHEVTEIMDSKDPWASKYYDMDSLITKWCPLVPELGIRRFDVCVTDNDFT